MYKVFSGEKCIMISAVELKVASKDTKTILFSNSEELHREYQQFSSTQKFQNLVVVGEEERTWAVFRSLFSYIEAAGGLVLNQNDELLMIYRNKHWDLPKGKMEQGETPDQTALREVEEECGVKKLKIVKPLGSSYHIFFQNNANCIKRTYWFEMSCSDASKLIPQMEEGIEAAKWMNKADAKKISGKVYLSLREVLATFFV